MDGHLHRQRAAGRQHASQAGQQAGVVAHPLQGGVAKALAGPMLERGIGVIYLPHSERLSHYFHCRICEQFDAVVHLDRTRALIPLEKISTWEAGEAPETYPFAV